MLVIQNSLQNKTLKIIIVFLIYKNYIYFILLKLRIKDIVTFAVNVFEIYLLNNFDSNFTTIKTVNIEIDVI